ncbi:sphingosine-1-phosphate phosphohydrolase-like protein [Aaosphaeria arxii CBS 175.79]|uniref:Sphingosine-1-phosphate phosphohydrolase-like protein n=1 Tax=Aaosphaeria arxii CBS 175.79 TaxID=1450172 RepID=A0A6A5XAJ6_9PLEO|nr:sphingosine-1-phosphate phosphohydrolase-like protein [Aaosphaeria arxii CBS 175.79]KAF2009961.1 sphingosine-1-phosphate phosphohydrolase-like protein [Aaosphaeria arxii CBS 175.79]
MTKVDPLSNAQNEPRLDAGNKHHDHYANALPKWRNEIRKKLIPIVRWETPYLALMQDALRTPALDSYFAFTANLGTHTFYMVFLPILFWCGYTNFGRAMVHMLAAGIFVSGFLKDMLCLPRPLSPPLARITMSGSAALEYGFPSSHSTNAVSVALYAIYMIRSAPEQYHPQVFVAVQALFWWYAISIIFGRLYCGMHGFLDVVIGSILGAIIGVGQLAYGDFLDTWIPDGPIGNLIISILVVLVLVRIHPEPADDCPCFDDSVSFAGVVLGIQVGAWQYARCAFSTNDPISSTVPFSIESIGWVRAVLRVILGVVMIFIWRASTKPALFKILPPLFRVLERVRWNLPRAFFLNASKYTSIPTLRGDDNVIPTASELPHMLKNLAHPRRRSVSVGPQSAADAYETLAYRNRRRRESINSLDGKMPEDSAWVPQTKEDGTQASPQQSQEKVPLGANMLPTPMASRVHSYEQMMGTGNAAVTTATPPERNQNFMGEDAVQSPTEEENEKREIFMKITKPRVRYDVEVVTKLIVYAGIGWLAVSGNPMLFQIVGLGMGVALVQ